LARFQPTAVVSLRDIPCSGSAPELFGAGVLLEEALPLPTSAYQQTGDLTPSWLDHLRWRMGKGYLHAGRIGRLADLQSYQRGGAVLRHVSRQGFRTFGRRYQRVLEAHCREGYDTPLFIDEGRALLPRPATQLHALVPPLFGSEFFGAWGVVSSTFPNPVDERVGQHVAVVEGVVLVCLERTPTEESVGMSAGGGSSHA
jgi:hypothetical protein